MEKVSVIISRNQHLRFVIAVIDAVHDIYDFKALHDIRLKPSVIAGRRQDRTEIILYDRVIGIKDLKKDDRMIFVQRYWYLRPVKEISDAFSCSESKVKMILLRSRKKLQSALEKEGFVL